MNWSASNALTSRRSKKTARKKTKMKVGYLGTIPRGGGGGGFSLSPLLKQKNVVLGMPPFVRQSLKNLLCGTRGSFYRVKRALFVKNFENFQNERCHRFGEKGR